MNYRVTISGSTVLEKSIQQVNFEGTQPDNLSISRTYPRNSIKITGMIDTDEKTVNLYNWALLPATNSDCYKDIIVEQFRAGQLVRKVRFNKAFVVDYSESYSNKEGAGYFTIYVRQFAGMDIECDTQTAAKVVQIEPETDSILEEPATAVSGTLSPAKTGSLKMSFTDRIANKKKIQDNSSIGPPLTEVKYGEQFTKKERKKVLKPKITYSTPEGYTYQTDELGRIVNCEGTLQLGVAKRKDYAQRTVGRDDRKDDDDGGHLIASIFKGSGDFDNLVAMNGNLNKGEWKKLENDWSEALKAKPPKEVKVNISPIYEGNSQRPVKFEIEYQIGKSRPEFREFKNKPGGK